MLKVRSRTLLLLLLLLFLFLWGGGVNGAVSWSFILVNGIIKFRLCLCNQLSINLFGHKISAFSVTVSSRV